MKASRDLLCLATAFFAIGAASAAHAEGLNLGRDHLVGSFWGVELGYLDRVPLFPNEPHTQGLKLSLVGKAPVAGAFGVFGKVGTNYGRPDASIHGAMPGLRGESSLGFAYGAGMSYSFSPRLSATLEWNSNDLRFMGVSRDPVRSTSLGLRYRY